MQRLAEDRQVDTRLLDRRILNVAEPVFQVIEPMFPREARSDSTSSPNYRSRSPCEPSREQLRERAFAGPEVCHRHRRNEAIKTLANACHERPGT